MNKKILISTVMLFGVCLQPFGFASEKMEGQFTVSKSCQAYNSIRKQRNPIKLEIGKQYKVLAKNKSEPTHYRIAVPESRANNNWVAVDCGTLDSPGARDVNQAYQRKDYLLALSWQPGFCLTYGKKKECQKGTRLAYSASKLSLHGLWPQPRNNTYCGVSETDRSIDRRGRWDLLQPLTLSETTKKALAVAMPGSASLLQRHEWVKHGTCYSKTAEQYYVDSIHLTKQVNKTSLDELLTQNKGKVISLSRIRQSVADSLGKSAASRIALRCGRKNQITEVWIGLSGDIQKTPLTQLMEQGVTPQSNCKSGQVAKY